MKVLTILLGVCFLSCAWCEPVVDDRESLVERGVSILKDFVMGTSTAHDTHALFGEVLNSHARMHDVGKIEGNSGESELMEQTNVHRNLATQKKANVVCETGFNMGHSALNWLLHSAPEARYYGFDAGEMFHKYPLENFKLINEVFQKVADATVDLEGSKFRVNPQPLSVQWGDSSNTLPSFVRSDGKEVKCDLIHVDGGHFGKVPYSDIRNLRALAKAESLLIIDDVNCIGWAAENRKSGCLEPEKSWQRAISAGIVREQACYRINPGRGFCFGMYLNRRRWRMEDLVVLETPTSKTLTRDNAKSPNFHKTLKSN